MAPLASPIYYDGAGMNAYICRYCGNRAILACPRPAGSAGREPVCGYDLQSGVSS